MLYIYNSCNYATVKNRTKIYKGPIKRIRSKRIIVKRIKNNILRLLVNSCYPNVKKVLAARVSIRINQVPIKLIYVMYDW